MKKDVLVFVKYLGFILPVLILAAGGYYLIQLQQTKKASIDAATSRIQASLVLQQASPAQIAADLAQAKATLSADKAKLAALTASEQSVSPVSAADIQQAYTTDHNAVKSTDILFKNPQTSSPKLIIKTSATIQAQIDLLRAKINTTFALWWALVSNTSSTGVIDSRVPAKEQQYAADIQAYVDDLKRVTDGLTPGNSGLSQAQIDAYQAVVDAAVKQATDVQKNIDAAATPPPQSPPVQQQQDVVNQDQAQINALQAALNPQAPVVPSSPDVPPQSPSSQGQSPTDAGATPPADTTPPSDTSAPLHLI
ncbi:MAG: hypothetical protein WCQ60_02895, partial [bacterium]